MGDIGPEFIIGGAPRCGTTWLYHALNAHPSIWLANPVQPEPKFFLVDEMYAKGLDYYRSNWFEGADAGSVRGEKSTNYMESRVAMDRIAADLPSVKMIFLLRDPVQRALSNYFWTLKNGLETLPVEEAMKADMEGSREVPENYRYARPFSYVSRGRYAEMLEPWFRSLGKDRVCVAVLEEVMTRPMKELAGMCAFLGVEADLLPEPDKKPVNQAAREGDPDEKVYRLLSDYYKDPNRRLSELLGRSLSSWTNRDE